MDVITRFAVDRDMDVEISGDSGNSIILYAAREMRLFLEHSRGNGAAGTEHTWSIVLCIDKSMESESFAVSCAKNSRTVQLLGNDSVCVLHAAYTLLERLGCLFDINGTTRPAAVDMNLLDGWHASVTPIIKNRGIRQHINFPMDVSGYPMADAKEYIRNLARLRMNFITFHSYPGQWYEVTLPSKRELAGGFFYGVDYKLHSDQVFRAIHNRKYFCIPEIEPLYEQPELKSKAAIEWLRELMGEAKRIGLRVQFSYEPRSASMEDCLATADAIVDQYPMIDRLELITQEAGGVWDESAALSVDDAKELIKELFGPDALSESTVTSALRDGLWQLPGTLRELAKNIRVINELRSRKGNRSFPELATGVYCTEPESLTTALALMRKYVPDDVQITILPAHGGRASAKSVNSIEMTGEDLNRSTVYSWLEFDGDMFLQQNGVKGIQMMIWNMQSICGGGRPNGVAFNHWRTTENRTAARYSALASIFGPISTEKFYLEYAESLNLSNPALYAKAMQELDDADTDTRNKLGNIGFCHEPCWHNAPSPLGYISLWSVQQLDEIRGQFDSARSKLTECMMATSSRPGADYLSFLINRLKCTSIHLKAMAKLVELQPICDGVKSEDLSGAQREQIREIFADAFKLINDYLDVHAEAIVDRGCEGTLVSYKDTIWLFATKLKASLLGESIQFAEKKESADEPPPPAI